MKQLGKKHPLLREQLFEIAHNQSTISLDLLLKLVVEQQVQKFNSRKVDIEDQDTTHAPVENYLQILTDTGKVGFGNLYNENKVDLTKAQENALLAFEDGMYAVFYGDDELSTLSQTIDLSIQQTFTFIRLTFLAGSYW